MSTPEGRTTAAIIKYLRQRVKDDDSFFWCKLHGGPMQRAGLPDLLVIHQSVAHFFEVKSKTGEPTALQVHTICRLQRAGAMACVVRSVDEVRNILE